MLKYGYVPESSHKGTDFKTTEKKERYLVQEKKKKAVRQPTHRITENKSKRLEGFSTWSC